MDYILMDCGRTNDCRDLGTDLIEATIQGMSGGYFIPHRKAVQPFSKQLVLDDLEFLEQHYDRIEEIKPGYGAEVLIYRKHGLAVNAAP